ncbi:hypothetical protein AIOL_001868 [Candidatus Rhodobacter oscarellae]|uniref:Bacterial transcriptional activator domain-containing protein n=1 Tax=Candidatus Rhodobacter oscarellae TaxID=1675527 RepID=A0A0J9E217_9RHOB|nr:BTAD domain-containing putative transcriptional regulator [Candidatus Rhodobacter lobularis]KMW56911.1 hypothetical protein AIOL_001868 [Candidatus Rhodobacter lobularis]
MPREFLRDFSIKRGFAFVFRGFWAIAQPMSGVYAASWGSERRMISINLFGKLSVKNAQGDAIDIAGNKSLCLIAYLALNMEMPPTRDRLMALFWGDRFTDQARQSLRQAIAKLKKTLSESGEDVLITSQDRIGFDPKAVKVDADQFETFAQGGTPEATRKAIALMSGPLLDGLYGQQAEFDDWLASERQRISTISLSVLERAAEQQLKLGDTRGATELARRLVNIDPLRDAGQVVLIRILAQQGERAAAIKQFNAYNATLQKELGVSAGPGLLQVVNEIKGETGGAKVSDPIAKAEAPSRKGNTSSRTSIGVSQFQLVGAETDAAFLTAGLSADITTNLSRFSWLDVKSNLTDDAAESHDADFIVHGTLRSQGQQFRLNVQLAETKSGRYVWASRYDRIGDDLFDIQDELSATIAASLEAELERLAGRSMRELALEDMNSWECYHRGLAIQYEFDAKTNLAAQQHFRRAIELDPNFGLAYARLSYAMVISAIYFEADNVADLLEEAQGFAIKAARLEPDDAVARFALGRVRLARGDYGRSITDLKSVIDLNPGMAQAHCGLGDSMAYSGQLDEAIACFEEAVRISPSDPYRWAFLNYGATAFLFKGDYESAAKWATEAEAVPNAHYWATAIRAAALAHMGQLDQARSAIDDLLRQRPGISCDFVRERLFYLTDPEQINVYISGLQKAGLS